MAVTVDSQIAGTHVAADLDPAVVARRLLAVNLSDLAACGAAPRFAWLALNAPADFDHRRFLAALADAVAEAGVVLAGGDLATTERLVASLTLLGDLDRERSWPGRDRARPDDVLWVGGTLGESALGYRLLGAGAVWADGVRLPRGLPEELATVAERAVRRHLLPEAQLALGREITGHERVAALDLSDGLARDLHRMLRASGVGAEIEASRLPAAPGAADLARWLGRDLLDLQLFGGEDYVLLFALPPDASPPEGCHQIGRIVEGEGARIRVGQEWRELEDRGWDHLTS